MVIAWMFGVLFGGIIGYGGHEFKDYQACLKEKPALECKAQFHIKG